MKKTQIPELLLENVCWSFSEPVPQSPSELIEAISKYAEEIGIKSCLIDSLYELSPFTSLNIIYTYGVQRDTNDWIDMEVKIRINGLGKQLSYADILWQIHKKVFVNLKSQDNHFFEGLHLVDEGNSEKIPTYEIYLGS